MLEESYIVMPYLGRLRARKRNMFYVGMACFSTNCLIRISAPFSYIFRDDLSWSWLSDIELSQEEVVFSKVSPAFPVPEQINCAFCHRASSERGKHLAPTFRVKVF